jgi:hypothetical protein
LLSPGININNKKGFKMQTTKVRNWTAVKTCEKGNLVVVVNRSNDGLWNLTVGSRRGDGTLAPHIPIFQSEPHDDDPIRDDLEGDLLELLQTSLDFVRDALDQSPRRLNVKREDV